MTTNYHHFAKHYHSGPYTLFAERVSRETFPHLLEVLDFSPKTLLDMACGSGIFAIAMAKKGLKVTGMDVSEPLLKIAREEAHYKGVEVEWVNASMSEFNPTHLYDCVTCWFDSLNYLLHIEDLSNTFKKACESLSPGGYFIFDMNTLYGLAVQWQRFPYFIQQETTDYLEITENSYDYELGIAEMRIIMFERTGKTWSRHEEIHRERGYAVDDILLLLENAGFVVEHLTGDPRQLTPLGDKDGRLWVVARKPAS